MTLHKAIEAAREALRDCWWTDTNPIDGGHRLHEELDRLEQNIGQALSALPAKPMSEDQILTLFADNDPSCPKNGEGWGAIQKYKGDTLKIIRALRDAGVLYVEEK